MQCRCVHNAFTVKPNKENASHVKFCCYTGRDATLDSHITKKIKQNVSEEGFALLSEPLACSLSFCVFSAALQMWRRDSTSTVTHTHTPRTARRPPHAKGQSVRRIKNTPLCRSQITWPHLVNEVYCFLLKDSCSLMWPLNPHHPHSFRLLCLFSVQSSLLRLQTKTRGKSVALPKGYREVFCLQKQNKRLDTPPLSVLHNLAWPPLCSCNSLGKHGGPWLERNGSEGSPRRERCELCEERSWIRRTSFNSLRLALALLPSSLHSDKKQRQYLTFRRSSAS